MGKLVSVIIPVYNGEDYIQESVLSICNQTYDNIEIVIINDGSTDKTEKILDTLEKKDNRIKVFNRVNNGLIKTLNFGLDVANGDYIARMDADDICLPTRIEKQVNLLDSKPNLIACGAQFERFGSMSRISSLPLTSSYCKINLIFSTPFCHPLVLFRKNNFRYKLDYKYSEDYKFWCDLCSIGEFENLNEILLKYRTHNNQISIVNAKNQIRKQIEISKEMISKIDGIPNDIYPKQIEAYLNTSSFLNLDSGGKEIVKRNILYLLPFLFNKNILAIALIKTFKLSIKEWFLLILRILKWRNSNIKI
ncbi:glycosyltransferase family 2 protein [Photobacterium leiognathi]|uniref:glycosyltransferase family 2 protein n=1 Tax=Photobacterium leiognathi TaxID=553611 RepID=UPI0029829867|nr:glycosyltransferase family 2 protein [Photobacterium leiognathi]